MSEDAAAPFAARPHRRISAFHTWRRGRPFWGGLLLILAGGEIFLSSNEDLGSLHVQIGVTGFLSYIVPLFIVLCGALALATPSQRMLYGILAIAASIYSVVSVNLGGFVLGMLLGIVGGSLTVAWVPDKFVAAEIPIQSTGEPDDLDTGYEPATSADDFFARPDDNDDEPTTSDVEGKQGARFPDVPGSRHGVDDTDRAMASFGPSPLPRRSPRALGLALVVALVATVGFLAVHGATPAVAADCVPPTLTDLIKAAKASPSTGEGTNTGNGTNGTSSAGKKAPVTRKANGEAPVVPQAQPTDPVGTLLGGIGKILGVTPSPSDSDSPSDAPSTPPSPSEAPTAPATPSTSPSTSPSPSSASPTKSAGKPGSAGSTAPAPDPSSSAPCAVIAKTLGAESGLPLAAATPSTQTAATLTMTNLIYDGNYPLTTKSGPIEVMQFSMDSSTSTPFELDTTANGKTIRTKSSELTVSGHVKLYATEIKGNLLGVSVLPVDYTPDNPPPLVTPVPFLSFTDVKIGLAFVTCDTLTADNLTITSPS